MKPTSKAVRCVCRKFLFIAPGRKIRCKNPACVFYGRGFATVADAVAAQDMFAVQAVEVCREFGLIKQC